jgi:hypothetical protein
MQQLILSDVDDVVLDDLRERAARQGRTATPPLGATKRWRRS